MKHIYAIIKPKGPTSHDMIDKLRKITGIRKIGHAGTLDPLASGVLVVGITRKGTRELGKNEKLPVNDKDWVVVSVPDSSNPAGSGFADILKLPHKEGLIRNRYVGRTFIESKSRSERVKEKFSIAREVFEGKNVFLIDDSVVRGTTMKGIIDFIKENAIIVFDDRPNTQNRKEFAMWAKQQEHPSLLFALYDGKSIDEQVWKYIQPKYEKPFKTSEEISG